MNTEVKRLLKTAIDAGRLFLSAETHKTSPHPRRTPELAQKEEEHNRTVSHQLRTTQ